jgi:hypothetical protein
MSVDNRVSSTARWRCSPDIRISNRIDYIRIHHTRGQHPRYACNVTRCSAHDKEARGRNSWEKGRSPMVRSGRTTREQVLRIQLDGNRAGWLSALAERLSIEPEQLAHIWIAEQIDRAAALFAMAPAPLGDTTIAPLDGSARAAESPSRGQPMARKRGRSDGRKNDSAAGSLHREIIAVLQDRGGPMSVSEIADEIRRRGLYRPPRTKHPITSAVVSRRVSNPNYRSMFERSDGRVRLARSPKG